eukprot:6205890-Pleurochrysis_carterae.AAC.5
MFARCVDLKRNAGVHSKAISRESQGCSCRALWSQEKTSSTEVDAACLYLAHHMVATARSAALNPPAAQRPASPSHSTVVRAASSAQHGPLIP